MRVVVIPYPKRFLKKTVGLVVAAQTFTYPVYAAYERGQVSQATKPIIDLLQDIAEPAAYGMMIWGLIKYIMGQEGEGIKQIKKAGWGYVGVQLLPWGFNIIKGLGGK